MLSCLQWTTTLSSIHSHSLKKLNNVVLAYRVCVLFVHVDNRSEFLVNTITIIICGSVFVRV